MIGCTLEIRKSLTPEAPTPDLPLVQGEGDPPEPQAARPSGRISRAALGALATAATSESAANTQ